MGFKQSTDLDLYEEESKKMGLCRSTDLKSYKYNNKGRKIMGFERSTDLDSYEERKKRLGLAEVHLHTEA